MMTEDKRTRCLKVVAVCDLVIKVCIAAAVICFILMLVSCDWGGIGNHEETTNTTNQTILYSADGVPIQVLARDGLYYVAVGEAPMDLLAERGLTRLKTGEVVPLS